jgi:hypothetical protein
VLLQQAAQLQKNLQAQQGTQAALLDEAAALRPSNLSAGTLQ